MTNFADILHTKCSRSRHLSRHKTYIRQGIASPLLGSSLPTSAAMVRQDGSRRTSHMCTFRATVRRG